MPKNIPLALLPLDWRHWYLFAVSAMEQMIGGALSTIVGIILPLIILLGEPKLSPLDQGLLASSNLIGIALGSVIVGKLMDKEGYLLLFRLCPLLIFAGSIGVYYSSGTWTLILCIFLIGLGVGGGYSLDSGYISEIMPEKWKKFLLGLAKATSSLGFFGAAVFGYFALKLSPQAASWRELILFIGFLGLITFIARIRWYQSPGWLMEKGQKAEAQKAAREFFGPDSVEEGETKTANDLPQEKKQSRGTNFQKIIFSGIPWACEGLGVYGIGVFLPILIMDLKLDSRALTGVPKILASLETTIWINFFIVVGFALGLAILHKVNVVKSLGYGFIVCAISMAMLWAAYYFELPPAYGLIAFVVFETALNCGPHLITYIIPSRIYSVQNRGMGMGLATLLGKVGAILGVFFMPLLLHWHGVSAVLFVSMLVQIIGATVSLIYGKKLGLL